MGEPCRLCHNNDTVGFAKTNNRDYLACDTCKLVFVSQPQLPDLETEWAEYRLHQNDPNDQRYRAHLAKLTTPLVKDLSKIAKGLDFGCGPGPTISVMLGEQGYDVANYDPAFYADKTLLQRQYDFISCTEVVEHFHNPARDFALLAGLLKPGGRLGIMTQLLNDEIDFKSWYYTREISHVAFYSVATMAWIGERFGWRVEVLGNDVILFETPSPRKGEGRDGG
ncbi:hypothetical protein MNBD_ALPHA08-1242 [hydrothermal vent metagenome]|uniref:Methyltransferase associated with DUF414 n=1 Tax=hydrothermal vent metagenome TaxID=652676 RepID=A0A3B0RGD3_9ZZZZ